MFQLYANLVVNYYTPHVSPSSSSAAEATVRTHIPPELQSAGISGIMV